MTDSTKQVGLPASPIAKPNVPVPEGIKPERPQTVRSSNLAGGEVKTSDYSKSK
jgi:hypothetical protein